jgi:hypothetical protein
MESVSNNVADSIFNYCWDCHRALCHLCDEGRDCDKVNLMNDGIARDTIAMNEVVGRLSSMLPTQRVRGISRLAVLDGILYKLSVSSYFSSHYQLQCSSLKTTSCDVAIRVAPYDRFVGLQASILCFMPTVSSSMR